MRTLGMSKPVLVAKSPNKPNVFYEVRVKAAPPQEVFTPLVDELRVKKETMDRVIIFAQTYEDTTNLYMFFKSQLKQGPSHPGFHSWLDFD